MAGHEPLDHVGHAPPARPVPSDQVAALFAPTSSDGVVLARARFVAEHWRASLMADHPKLRWAAHPLCMVLAALDGETDPAECGIDTAARKDWPTEPPPQPR